MGKHFGVGCGLAAGKTVRVENSSSQQSDKTSWRKYPARPTFLQSINGHTPNPTRHALRVIGQKPRTNVPMSLRFRMFAGKIGRWDQSPAHRANDGTEAVSIENGLSGQSHSTSGQVTSPKRPALQPTGPMMPLLPAGLMKPSGRQFSEAAIRARAHTAYLGDHTALCRILGRYKLYADTRDIGLASHLMLDGYWEMWVTEAITELVSPGMHVADIGANLGYYSLLLADLIGPTGKVSCFEPNPRLAHLLGNSLAVNGMSNAQVNRVALGGEHGEQVVLVVPPGEPKNGYVIPYVEPLPENGVAVATARLDADVAWSDIEFAKIDVEGAEEQVWEGMKGLLEGASLKTIVLEFAPCRYSDPQGFIEKLLEPGFKLARIDFWAGIVDTTAAEVLAGDPHADVMLVLRR